MKKILNVIVLTLAMNFLLVAAGSALLLQKSRMDGEKFAAVKKLLFETSQPTTMQASTQSAATTEPADRLAELLARASGHPAGEQVNFLRQAFDTEMAELDRKQRELSDLQHQIELARNQTRLERVKIEQEKTDLQAQKDLQAKLASDKGFQDSLELYNNMKPKQVKTIFMTLSDDTMMQYLQAMEPRTATKIINEFKQPEETTRIQKVLEKIRQSQAGTSPLTPASPVPVSPQAALPPN